MPGPLDASNVTNGPVTFQDNDILHTQNLFDPCFDNKVFGWFKHVLTPKGRKKTLLYDSICIYK